MIPISTVLNYIFFHVISEVMCMIRGKKKNVCADVRLCVCVRACVFASACVYVRACVCLCVCMCACVRVYGLRYSHKGCLAGNSCTKSFADEVYTY